MLRIKKLHQSNRRITAFNSFRSKFLLFFVLSICFFVGGFFLNKTLEENTNDYSKSVGNVERVISVKEQFLNRLLDQAFDQIQLKGSNSLFGKKDFNNLTVQGYSVLCFENDTLKYWSDNNVPVETVYNQSLFESNCCQIGNGWYRLIKKEEKSIKLVGLILIKNNYRYENDYLQNDFQKDFSISPETKIQKEVNENAVYTKDGSYLFSLKFKNRIPLTEWQDILLFLLYLCGLMFFISALFQLHKLQHSYYKSNTLFIFGFVLDLLIFRLLIFHYKLPGELYKSFLFGPLKFASSELLPSFGDLLVNTLLFIIIAWVFYKHFDYKPVVKRRIHAYWKIIVSSISIIVLAFSYFYIIQIIKRIVIDSIIPYTLNNIFNLNVYSVFGFLVIASLLFGFVLISIKVFKILFRITESVLGFLVSAVIALVVISFCTSINLISDWWVFSSFVVFVVGNWLFRERAGLSFLFARLIFGLIFYSTVTTIILYNCNNFKEEEKRKSLAQKLSTSQDPIAEYLFENLATRIVSDEKLKSLTLSYPIDESKIQEYILENYFSGYWDKYQIQITVCNKYDSLFIRPAMVNQNCNEYFDKILIDFGRPTSTESLAMLNYGTGGNSYLSKFYFPIDSLNKTYIYIELYSKFIPKGLGYPELLIDKKIFLNTDLSNYSYARYRNKELVDGYGKYYYSIIQDTRDTLASGLGFFDRNGYNHLFYRIDQNSNLIVSKKNGNFLDKIAPFSLLFLFFAFYVLSFFLIISFPLRINSIKLNFKNRLQISMISIILISFILIGVSMYYYIRNLNENKNIEHLSEKAMSILIETQSKMANYDSLTPEMDEYMANWLLKFSNVFFSDINLFDLNGNLISSSRPQVFYEGLVANKMNPIAYNELAFNKKTIFINKEKIGSLEFYSAYLPFYNNRNKLIAYLNLPYFARENELKQELSTFMMTFINIYVFLIAIAIIIALIIAGRMTRPLKEIRDKISQIKLGGRNEKIIWVRQDDEIGSLVKEYNRMIDELALSADLLAKSERESAWREMAKQVAHEIKNPLTPMKLSVQYLEKAWKEKTPDWEQKLKRFTKTLIEQIESLSAIASAFSDFAKLPKSEMKRIDLEDTITTSITVFSGSKINIDFDYNQNLEYYVLADKKQIIRVLNNLITNAIQAIGNQNDGRIIINIKKDTGKIVVSVIDNGPGITEEQKPRIFIPNFSTKSEGMGLGLAMVKSTIESHGGTIWFMSRVGEGASFCFELPEDINDAEI